MSVEGKEIAEGSLIAYIDYLLRDEIAQFLAAGKFKGEVDPVAIAAELKDKVLKRAAGDLSDQIPNVFQDLSRRIKEAIK